jgi:hypothetical protein
MEKDLRALVRESLQTGKERFIGNFCRILVELLDGQSDVDILAWLRESNPALGGFPPIDLLWSNYGTQVLLEHIESWNNSDPT